MCVVDMRWYRHGQAAEIQGKDYVGEEETESHLSTKEPLNIGHFCRKWPIKIRDSLLQKKRRGGARVHHICMNNICMHVCLLSIYTHTSYGHAQPHTATNCNTLQHTATHCNTLQHMLTVRACVKVRRWIHLYIHMCVYICMLLCEYMCTCKYI